MSDQSENDAAIDRFVTKLKNENAALRQRVEALEHEYGQLKESYDAKEAGIPIGPIVGAQTIMNQQLYINTLTAKLEACEQEFDEYRQAAMEEVRKACQDAGVLVAEHDSISISKAGDIALKVAALQRQLQQREEEIRRLSNPLEHADYFTPQLIERDERIAWLTEAKDILESCNAQDAATIEQQRARLDVLEGALKEARHDFYLEMADEFHPNVEMGDTARGLCAQFEALFLRRATECKSSAALATREKGVE